MIASFITRLKQEAIRRLCPELADLRAQLEHTRRLASDTQARYREAERTVDTWRSRCHDFEIQLGTLRGELARAKVDIDARHGPLLGPIVMERDHLRAEVASLKESLAIVDAMAKDQQAGATQAMRYQDEAFKLRARVAELEAERSKMIEGGPLAEPRPKLATDGQPIAYIDPSKRRHSLKPNKY